MSTRRTLAGTLFAINQPQGRKRAAAVKAIKVKKINEMKVTIIFFIEAKDEAKAKKVLNQIIEKNNHIIQLNKFDKYEKINGFKITTYFQKKIDNWEKIVFELITTAQGLGNGWTLTGNINEEVDMTTNNTKISGLKFIHISCIRIQND